MTFPADAVVVSSLGLVCPVGLDVLAATAAIRAGVSRMRDAPEATVPAGDGGLDREPAVAGRVPGVARDVQGIARDARLLAPALSECLGRAGITPNDVGTVDVRVATDRDATALAGLLGDAAGPDLRVTAGPLVQTAFLDGVAQAAEAIVAGRARRVVVAAAGSLSEPDTLRALGRAGRLKSALGDGIMPGEAGAAALVERAVDARTRGVAALAAIAASGAARERHPWTGTEPSRADGLSHALRAATGGVRGHDLGLIVADLNGERERAREWAVAEARALPFRHDQRDLWHPATSVGDAGVGAGGVLVCLAALALARGFTEAEGVVVCASDDDGERRALVLAPADRVDLVLGGPPPLSWSLRR